MGKLSKSAISRALCAAKDIPREWQLSIYGAPHWELHLRMSRIQRLEFDFVWGADFSGGPVDVSLPDPSLILVLDVSLNDLTALEHHQLSPFIHLRHLDASLNQIQHFNGIAAVHRLCFLNLSHNQIGRLTSELSKCQSLVKLDLSVNQIDTVSTMPTLSNLSSLNIRNNKLKSLEGLQSLLKLEELFVQNNKITDILSISGCRCLRIFEAANNRLSSLTAVVHSLKRLPKLHTLSLYGNPVEKAVGYRATLVNNTTLCVLDNITVHSPENRTYLREIVDLEDGREKLRWTVERDGRHWLPVIDTTRLAFEHRMAKKKRQIGDEMKALRDRAVLLQEEYIGYELKTKREMEDCLHQLRSAAYDDRDRRPFDYDHFRYPRNPWPSIPPDEWDLLRANYPNTRLEPVLPKPSYRNLETGEALRHTYNELIKLQRQQRRNDQSTYDPEMTSWNRNGLWNI